MSAHVRPDDAPMLLPGFEPSPIHEALNALSWAADAACSRAAMGCPVGATLEDLDAVQVAAHVARGTIAPGPSPSWVAFAAVWERAREWARACAMAETARDHYRRGGDGEAWASAEAARFEGLVALDAALRAIGLCVSHADTLRAVFHHVDKSGGP